MCVLGGDIKQGGKLQSWNSSCYPKILAVCCYGVFFSHSANASLRKHDNASTLFEVISYE